MNLQEYKIMLNEEFSQSAEVSSSTVEMAFIDYIRDMFNDNEEVMDLKACYLNIIGAFKRKILIDGYAYEEADKSLTLFISKYDYSEDLVTITQTEINDYIRNMEAFYENSISRFIQKNTEYSSFPNAVAEEVFRRYNNGEIQKFKFYIITNCLLSDRVKTIKHKDIDGRNCEVIVWDIEKMYNSDSSCREKEPISIDVKKYCNGQGIPAIQAFGDENSEYTAYLAVIPGTMLAEIYNEYGSRLLEGNVRSFLSATGKVNKGIKETILKTPKYFFTYNNGIATTASSIETEITENGLMITAINDLQIINGGQTTASLLNARINNKNEAKLEDVFVAMKLTVVNGDERDIMIEKISRYANSQNKVSDADFFSNSPFHMRFEQLSNSPACLAPAVNGNQYQTRWFYERARGSYKQEQMKLTKAEREKFALRNPKSQLISKTDLAKYLNTYYCMPHLVSRGAQKNMKEFAEIITDMIKNTDEAINEFFFKQSVSIAIMFKELDKSIKNSDWFAQGSGYKANVLTYAISKLFDELKTNYKDRAIDFEKIWNKQTLYPELKRQLLKISKIVYESITAPNRGLQNVTEWCKKEECWKIIKAIKIDLDYEFIQTLISQEVMKEKQKNAKKDQRINNNIEAEVKVVELGSEYWARLLKIAKERKIINMIEEADLNFAANIEITGRVPNTVQAKRILKIRQKCSDEGIDVDNLMD